MAYSTVENVKLEAGFSDNTNIADNTVTRYITASDDTIDGVLSKLYTLPLSETPGIIEQISRLMSAGYLMMEQYGTEAEGTSFDGQAKIDQAMALLKKIELGETLLVGTDGVELATSSGTGLKGFPASNSDYPAKITIDTKF